MTIQPVNDTSNVGTDNSKKVSNTDSIDAAALELVNLSLDEANLDKFLDGYIEEQNNRILKEILLNPSDEDIKYLTEKISTRLEEGRGETLFEIGLEDDGSSMNLSKEEYEKCIKTIETVCDALGAGYANIDELAQTDTIDKLNQTSTMNELKQIDTMNELMQNDTITKGNTKKQHDGIVTHLMIRKIPKSVEDSLEIRIAVVGNVDAGKSTVLGVLTKGVLDDGRGKARLNLFRHKHEIESGRTSSVGGEILGFDSKSNPIIQKHAHDHGTADWKEITNKAAKIISFVDLAGHEKYLKTTVCGMMGSSSDFVMLMVGANAGMNGMSKEHLGLALSLNIPVLVVVTKIDMCPPNILKATLEELTKILKSKSCKKFPLHVLKMDDVISTAHNFVSERLCPIFQVSNVTGQGIPLLRSFINILPSFTKYDNNTPFHYEINETYSVPFVGTVVSGILKSGVIHKGDKVLLGPDHTGEYTTTTIKGIHLKRVLIPTARAGQCVTFALKNVRRNTIRKGQVLLPYDSDKMAVAPKASKRFEAEVLVMYHSTTIKRNYQAMVHCGAVRQTATIIKTDKEVLRAGDRTKIMFEFVKNPEYLTVGSRLIFREGRTKGVGKITQLLD